MRLIKIIALSEQEMKHKYFTSHWTYGSKRLKMSAASVDVICITLQCFSPFQP